MLFTVATGYRSNATGALENVGTNGYAWSSSSYAAGNVNAGMLNFNSGNVNPLNNGNRAIARAVRCVQHLHGAVFYLLAFGLRGRNRMLRPGGPRVGQFVPAGGYGIAASSANEPHGRDSDRQLIISKVLSLLFVRACSPFLWSWRRFHNKTCNRKRLQVLL
ncbi:hypothetical protein [uncultured Alistipes sp.]|uniref:hypothetical protein n=1 Tax=uncultured Alistipes sp. TaxID=538949 RepID=UPI0025F4A214|nr:hypothetical protein [uncultured Alistipes sp.]